MPQKSVFTPHYPPQPVGEIHWEQLSGCSGSLLIANASDEYKGLLVVITADMQSAYQLESELNYFTQHNNIHLFPDRETLPYDMFAPVDSIISDRLKTLSVLPNTQQGILIVSASTLMHRLPPVEYVTANSMQFKTGDTLDIELIRDELQSSGYRNVGQVLQHGEYATRGSLIDLYPMGSPSPYRIDLFDDEIDSIRRFDPETQRTIDKVDAIDLLPAHEYPLTQEGITAFRQRYRANLSGDTSKSLVYTGVSEGHPPPGIDYYLPLFFDKTATLFDYLPDKSILVFDRNLTDSLEHFSEHVANRYEQYRHDIERPILPPEMLFLSSDEIDNRIDKTRRIITSQFKNIESDIPQDGDTVKEGIHNYHVTPLPAMQIQPRAEEPLFLLHTYLKNHTGRVLFAAESAGRREELISLLKGNGYKPKTKDTWQEFIQSTAAMCITVAPLDEGIWLEDSKISIIPESLLLGKQVQQHRRRKKTTRDADAIIRNLTDLSEGAPVVHEEHGVGRYLGMKTLETGDSKAEYLMLEYSKGDKLYVPVASLHLISRYTGTSPENAPLHRLGSEQWDKARKKAAQKAHDTAAELLEIHARRAAKKGQSFVIDSQDYQAFSSSFPFEETPDQGMAIEAVAADMQSSQPMDRVVCGDVGFGKTEVAMRAAFIAANTGKQVAMIAPTTLLVQQHLQNFQDRFADWPFNIESLSRFQTPKQTREALDRLARGKIDIVIGTHKLLQKDIDFKQLGLVIIDEEHRFGVRHKEQLKKLRANIDLLTLTATPIPRTLNMSLAGIRDLSIIATPPVSRHAVKTFVCQWDKHLIQEACSRELSRGGQIYVLHNEVKTIEKITKDLTDILPDTKVRYAHGQMRERELEAIMEDFYHQRFHVLVATTIIESGIDVPSANTIIINRADKLGLAQLHQLRGRVGRSHHRAYAYLVTPPPKTLTSDAKKRLEAIESLEELGVGFTLASHDLEIRGAGELLGEDQSGQIQEIGFSLYNELLERAVNALKAGHIPDLEAKSHQPTTVDIGETTLIPDEYIPDVHTRLILYKRIASAADKSALKDLRIEMIDRFGLLPDPATHLFTTTELKLTSEKLGIIKLELRANGGRIHFSEKPNIDPIKIIGLIQKRPWQFKMNGQDKLNFEFEKEEVEDRVQWIKKLFSDIRLPE